jgi:hypothetical protein
LHSDVAVDLIREALEDHENVFVRSIISVGILSFVLFLVELIIAHQLFDIMVHNLDLFDDVLLLRVRGNFMLYFALVR